MPEPTLQLARYLSVRIGTGVLDANDQLHCDDGAVIGVRNRVD